MIILHADYTGHIRSGTTAGNEIFQRRVLSCFFTRKFKRAHTCKAGLFWCKVVLGRPFLRPTMTHTGYGETRTQDDRWAKVSQRKRVTIGGAQLYVFDWLLLPRCYIYNAHASMLNGAVEAQSECQI